MFTIPNAVMVAIGQVGVIVIGILAASLSGKLWQEGGIITLPFPTFLLVNYGLVLFLCPLLWVTFATAVRLHPWISDDAKDYTFAVGIFLLIALLLFEGYAVFLPWTQCCFVGGFGDADPGI